MKPESKDVVDISQPNRRTKGDKREKLRLEVLYEQVCQDRRESRAHGATKRLVVTQTNQLEEDIGGQREIRILGGDLSQKETGDVIKLDVGEHGVDI